MTTKTTTYTTFAEAQAALEASLTVARRAYNMAKVSIGSGLLSGGEIAQVRLTLVANINKALDLASACADLATDEGQANYADAQAGDLIRTLTVDKLVTG